jgi:hypothetical protein
VSAGRPAFEDLVLTAVEPTACLAHLGFEVGVPLGGLEHV